MRCKVYLGSCTLIIVCAAACTLCVAKLPVRCLVHPGSCAWASGGPSFVLVIDRLSLLLFVISLFCDSAFFVKSFSGWSGQEWDGMAWVVVYDFCPSLFQKHMSLQWRQRLTSHVVERYMKNQVTVAFNACASALSVWWDNTHNQGTLLHCFEGTMWK